MNLEEAMNRKRTARRLGCIVLLLTFLVPMLLTGQCREEPRDTLRSVDFGR